MRHRAFIPRVSMRIRFSVTALGLLALSACGASGSPTSAGTAAAATVLTFTGELTGKTSAMRASGHAALCDTQPDPSVLDREFAATLGSFTYTFEIYVRQYAGPRSYSVGVVDSANLSVHDPAPPHNPRFPVGGLSGLAGTVTIGSDTRWGDMDVDLGTWDWPGPGTKSGHVQGRWTCAPGASPPAPLTLTGTGSKVTNHFILKQGYYKLAWSATGPPTNFIVTAHWGSNGVSSARVVEDIPPQPPSGESLLPAPEAGDYYLDVQADTLAWTITITPA